MPAVSSTNFRRKFGIIFGVLVLLAILSLTALLVVRKRTGTGLGLRSLPRHIWHLTQAVWNKDDPRNLSTGNYDNIIFLHHSTGDHLINQGSVRELLTDSGFNFWDQSYNRLGLRDPNGVYTGYSYSVPRDNTDPDGLAKLFQQPVYDLPLNAFSGLLQHEVIVFKSCFAPTSKISSDAQLQQYQEWYLTIRDQVDQHPDKLFILVTQPPLNPAETDSEEAHRARLLAGWLMSNDYLGDRENFRAFDLFDYLAEVDPDSDEYNMLKEIYRYGNDSHPNDVANQELGPIFAEFIMDTVREYRGH